MDGAGSLNSLVSLPILPRRGTHYFSILLYIIFGGPCQQFVADPQILSQSLGREEK